MSTTSSIAPGSRSSSPLTPEASDCPEPVSIQAELDQISSWYSPMHPPKSTLPRWVSDLPPFPTPHKVEEENMLHLDELIEQDAYEDSPHAELHGNPLPSQVSFPDTVSLPSGQVETVKSEFGSRTLVLQGLPAVTKPIPPPAALPRKPEISPSNQRVVTPPKEACFNLPIMFPSIPEGGTKSRVETQVRITMDLAHSSSSDPFKYDRVGSWKWLKLPQGTATKRRTRKQGKIDPEPLDTLHLTASVACSTPPHNTVISCSSCQAREAKRVAKKLAARVRPARSDSDSDGNGTGKPKTKTQEDTTSVIQFNCAEVLDFSTGSVVLPLRITCYCRHHREKVGFNVHFTMVDHCGRIVGTGMTKPIMITDDHKTSSANKPTELTHAYLQSDRPDWSRVGGILNEASGDVRAPSRRKTDSEGNVKSSKKRHKPYDASAKPSRVIREGSISSAPSPSTIHSPVPPTRASTPASLQNLVTSDPPPASQPPPLHHPLHGSETSSPDTLATPLDHNSDVPMPPVGFDMPDILPEHQLPALQPGTLLHPSVVPSDLSLANLPPPLPFLFLNPNSATQPVHVQIPIIHRLIPNSGPTFGGIEVTLLGANFHPTMQLTCVFGDITASSTQIWSDNTLVCILPAQTTPGVVPVWFDGFARSDDSPLFTYMDETDRALMELALQVVGLKMTGKIEDAKNVAMRIVGNTSSNSSDANNNAPGMIHISPPSIRDLRALLVAQAGEIDNFESRIIDFLSILDMPLGGSAPHSLSTSKAVSCPSSSGQTLLHLSAFLGLVSLTRFLIEHGADLDVRDCNGFTALHFAALAQSHDCAAALINAGADLEIVDSRGRTSEEMSPSGIIRKILARQEDAQSEDSWEDEDGDLGDAEEDSDSELRRILERRTSTKTSRHNQSGKGTPHWSANVSRAATPPPATSSDEKGKKTDFDKQPMADAKRAASFMEKMRTFAQIPSRPGIIPNIPQLPLPHLSAVPWATLPQIPMVFPVFVPINWASLRGGLNPPTTGSKSDSEGDEATKNVGNIALRTAHEWRATWEKWVALAIATTARQQADDIPPPVYTPRAEEETQVAPQSTAEVPEQSVTSTSRRLHTDTRPVGYDSTPVPDQVVESFAYQPNTKPSRRLRKKHDRMLLLFWLPILLLSLVWAFHNGVRVVLQVVRMVVPAKGQKIQS